MIAVYLLKSRDMAGQNFWQNMRSLPVSFYKSNADIEPLDDTLRKVHENAYANHIERLMIIGKFCLLARIHPEEVYRWFMEMFIDAYEWVMVPNVYSMSQYSDGGSITSKLYVSSSSYIKRMSDYAEGEWSSVWDSLFWNFIEENREKIENIPRMKVILYNLDKKPPDKMRNYRKITHDVMERLKTSSPA